MLKQAKESTDIISGDKPLAFKLSDISEFSVANEAASLSEVELSQYYREKGLYLEQPKIWKNAGFKTNIKHLTNKEKTVESDKYKLKNLHRTREWLII